MYYPLLFIYLFIYCYPKLRIWPGHEKRLNLEGIDQFDNPTYLIVRLSDRRSGINLGAFSQAGNNQGVNTTVSQLLYHDLHVQCHMCSSQC